MRNLWSAVWKHLRCVSRASEGVDLVRRRHGAVRVYCAHGLGFGSDVTIVVRLDEGLDRPGSVYG